MKHIALCIAMLTSLPATAAELNVKINGIRNDVGNIRLAIFAGEDFLNFDKVISRAQTKAIKGSVLLKLPNLPTGSYSFSVAHDENLNGTADLNFLGIPKEGVGVSNNAKGFLGPPSAEKATFELLIEGTDQEITLEYY